MTFEGEINMTLKRVLFILGLVGTVYTLSFAVWDVTTPSGSESRSLGDDRIRELKTDVQTALQFDGDFPGSDTSNPHFTYTPSTGTTALRPSGDDAVSGRLYINKTSGTIEQSYGTGGWQRIDTVGNASEGNGIGVNHISTSIAGPGLSGGNGSALEVIVDSGVFAVVSDSITFAPTPVINSSITFRGTITTASTVTTNGALVVNSDFSMPNRTRFIVYNSLKDDNVTGDGTPYTVQFDGEVVDTGGNFSVSTFTATSTGYYQFNVSVQLWQTGTPKECEIRLITSNRTYVQEAWPTSVIPMSISTLADMDATDKAWVDIRCEGGSKDIDVGGEGDTNSGTGITTFFSGYLAN